MHDYGITCETDGNMPLGATPGIDQSFLGARNDLAISATSPKGLNCLGREFLPYLRDGIRHCFVDWQHDRVAQLFLPAFRAIARHLPSSIRLLALAFGRAVRPCPAAAIQIVQRRREVGF